MISFKAFLQEAAVGNKPTIAPIDVKQAVALLNSKCKDALWMLHENRPIYRGDESLHDSCIEHGFATVNPSVTTRKSENTSNFYTEIFDNHPEYKDFPKRSRSYICAAGPNGKNNAWSYGSVSIIIPFDDVKIGCVNRHDMWNTKLSLCPPSPALSLDELNDSFFSNLFDHFTGSAWAKLLQFDKKPNKARIESVIDEFVDGWGFKEATGKRLKSMLENDFLKTILDIYSLKNTKFTLATTKTLNRVNGEIWVGGPCVVISENMWKELRQAIK